MFGVLASLLVVGTEVLEERQGALGGCFPVSAGNVVFKGYVAIRGVKDTHSFVLPGVALCLRRGPWREEKI